MNKKALIIACSLTYSTHAHICEFSHPLLQVGVRYIFRLDEHEECQRNWFTQLVTYFCTADQGYNDKGKKVDLADVVFGKQFSIRDFYLASKLAGQGKVTTATAPNQNEQYIALLSETRVGVEAESREFTFNFSAFYYDRIPGTNKLIGACAMLIPFVHQYHILTGSFLGGSLLDSTAGTTTSLTEFFTDFQSMEDFVIRGILAPKNLKFRQLQREAGIGDLNIMGLIDAHEYINKMSGAQVGLNVVAPTGRKLTGQTVWEPELGQEAGWLFDPFINFIFQFHRYINPLFFFGFRSGPPQSITRRVPQLKNQANQVLFSPSFATATVSQFSEFDSSVVHLADQAVPVRIRPGMQVILRVANFCEDVFIENFRVGVNYIFTSKGKDEVRVESPQGRTFDTALLEKNSEKIQHFFVWNIAYGSPDKSFEVYLGSEHIFAGRNVPQDDKFFVSLRWQF